MVTKISRERCVSCGICPALCPNLYQMDSFDKAVVLNTDHLDRQELIEANEAVDSCPTHAISIEG